MALTASVSSLAGPAVTTRATVGLRIALPKGRMADGVVRLLRDAGIGVNFGARDYRPTLSLPDSETKLLKPHNAIEMLACGTRDVGFAGADWVEEKQAELIEVLDTGLDPVRIVAAAPESILVDGELPRRRLIVASEYRGLTANWIAKRGLEAQWLPSYGATEVFPPEDADCIVDNTATGATLVANALVIIDELMRSSTRLYASVRAWADPTKRRLIEDLALVLEGVLRARQRVLLEMNVAAERLDAVVSVLPAMRQPTVAPLYAQGGADSGFAVRAAIPKSELALLLPRLRALGAADILVADLTQLVP